MKLRLLGCLSLVLACAGCASLPPLAPDCVRIGPAGAICPLPPADMPQVQASHLVTVTHKQEKHTFLGRLRINHEALRLAGASLFGTHLFTITWDGKAIVSEPPEPSMHPDMIVVMLEAALADPQTLRPRLHGIDLEVSHVDGHEIRQLSEHGHPVARIERHGGKLADAHLSITIPPAQLQLELAPMNSGDSHRSVKPERPR